MFIFIIYGDNIQARQTQLKYFSISIQYLLENRDDK